MLIDVYNKVCKRDSTCVCFRWIKSVILKSKYLNNISIHLFTGVYLNPLTIP